MFGDLAVVDAIEVVEGGELVAEGALGDDEDEVAFAEDLVDALVADCFASLGEILQAVDEAGEMVGDPGIVLDVVDAVKIVGEFISAAGEEVVHIALHESFVGLGFVEVGGCGGAVDHGVAAWAGSAWSLLEVVPVLDGLAVFEAEDVEADLGAEEVVLGVEEDEIAILEDANGVDPGGAFGESLKDGGEAGQTIGYGEVVLRVAVGVDVSGRLSVIGLETLQKLDGLLFVAFRHKVLLISENRRNAYSEEPAVAVRGL